MNMTPNVVSFPTAQIITGAANVWVQGAAASLAPYVGGYVIGISFLWVGAGAVNAFPVEIEVGIGPNGGPGVSLIDYGLPTTYMPNPGPPAAAAPASILVTQWSGTSYIVDLRSPGSGGVPITANTTWPFARVMTALSAAFAPTVVPQFVISMP